MRRGFNLIDLLVVIIIIAILLALLFPAVSKVRKAAIKQACKNRLQQIGHALNTYRDTHGHYPAAAIPNEKLAPDERLNWCAALLPHVEQEQVYKKLDL